MLSCTCARPSSLTDVLRCARGAGGDKRLVIELKKDEVSN
jgi:hypothetical protein